MVVVKDQIPKSQTAAKPVGHSETPSREGVHLMFDRIALRYDLLNHLLSFGLDIYWRRRAVSLLEQKRGQTILDLACGTGDLAIAAAKSSGNSRRIIGIDRAEKMLALAAGKIYEKQLGGEINLVHGDGMNLPFSEKSLDAAMIAFGIRNMPDTGECLREMTRVLKTGGRIIVLEFSLPTNRFFRTLHLFYLRQVLPRIGRWVSGDSEAYRYLDKTVETYLQADDFCREMAKAGLAETSATPLTMGIVTIYTGRKI